MVSVYRVRIESFHCDAHQAVPVKDDKKSAIHFLPRQTNFLDALDIIVAYYKENNRLLSNGSNRFWIKASDDEYNASLESQPRSSKKSRILSPDITDITEDRWKYLRYPMNENLGTLLGNKECLQIIVETTSWKHPQECEWPRWDMLDKWKNNLQQGDVIDAQDKFKKWYISVVREVDPIHEVIVVHFKGWSSEFDEKISTRERHNRIRPAFTESFNRYNWKEGELVDVKISDDQTSSGTNARAVWMTARITAVDKAKERIQVTYKIEQKLQTLAQFNKLPAAVGPFTCDDDKKNLKLPAAGTSLPADVGEEVLWFDVLSDDICPVYTHVQKNAVASVESATVTNHKDAFASSMSMIHNKPPPTYATYSRNDYYSERNTTGEPPVKGGTIFSFTVNIFFYLLSIQNFNS